MCRFGILSGSSLESLIALGTLSFPILSFFKGFFRGSYPFLKAFLGVPILFVKAFLKGKCRGNIGKYRDNLLLGLMITPLFSK